MRNNAFFMNKLEQRNTLKKAERLSSKIQIDRLFSGGSKSLVAFPLRIVFTSSPKNEEASASILTSVPKKYFHHAVDRNFVKRELREAYRKNKHILLDYLSDKDYGVAIGFIWLSKDLCTAQDVENKVRNLLLRMTEKFQSCEKS